MTIKEKVRRLLTNNRNKWVWSYRIARDCWTLHHTKPIQQLRNELLNIDHKLEWNKKAKKCYWFYMLINR